MSQPPRILYHITPRGNKRSIEDRGLLPAIDDVLENGIPGVNLTTGAEHYRDPTERDAICLVDTMLLDRRKLWLVDGWWWRYDDIVPPSCVVVAACIPKKVAA